MKWSGYLSFIKVIHWFYSFFLVDTFNFCSLPIAGVGSIRDIEI